MEISLPFFVCKIYCQCVTSTNALIAIILTWILILTPFAGPEEVVKVWIELESNKFLFIASQGNCNSITPKSSNSITIAFVNKILVKECCGIQRVHPKWDVKCSVIFGENMKKSSAVENCIRHAPVLWTIGIVSTDFSSPLGNGRVRFLLIQDQDTNRGS